MMKILLRWKKWQIRCYRLVIFMSRKKMETGLIVVKHTKFDKIRRRLMIFFYGKDYKIIERYQQLVKINRPKNIIICKEIRNI